MSISVCVLPESLTVTTSRRAACRVRPLRPLLVQSYVHIFLYLPLPGEFCFLGFCWIRLSLALHSLCPEYSICVWVLPHFPSPWEMLVFQALIIFSFFNLKLPCSHPPKFFCSTKCNKSHLRESHKWWKCRPNPDHIFSKTQTMSLSEISNQRETHEDFRQRERQNCLLIVLITHLSLAGPISCSVLIPAGLPLCSAAAQQLVCLLVDETSLSSEQLLSTAGMLHLPGAPDYFSSQNTCRRDVSKAAGWEQSLRTCCNMKLLFFYQMHLL